MVRAIGDGVSKGVRSPRPRAAGVSRRTGTIGVEAPGAGAPGLSGRCGSGQRGVVVKKGRHRRFEEARSLKRSVVDRRSAVPGVRRRARGRACLVVSGRGGPVRRDPRVPAHACGADEPDPARRLRLGVRLRAVTQRRTLGRGRRTAGWGSGSPSPDPSLAVVQVGRQAAVDLAADHGHELGLHLEVDRPGPHERLGGLGAPPVELRRRRHPSAAGPTGGWWR